MHAVKLFEKPFLLFLSLKIILSIYIEYFVVNFTKNGTFESFS